MEPRKMHWTPTTSFLCLLQHIPEIWALVKLPFALGGNVHWKEGSLE
jgi:hypothetical protein